MDKQRTVKIWKKTNKTNMDKQQTVQIWTNNKQYK